MDDKEKMTMSNKFKSVNSNEITKTSDSGEEVEECSFFSERRTMIDPWNIVANHVDK